MLRSSYEEVINEAARDLASCAGCCCPSAFASAGEASVWLRAFGHKEPPGLVADKDRRLLLLTQLEGAFEKVLVKYNPAYSKSHCGHAALAGLSAYLSGFGLRDYGVSSEEAEEDL